MRKALIGIIMAATVLTPVAAQAQDSGRGDRMRQRYERQGERNQARVEQRQERQAVREQRQERQAVREPRAEQRQQRAEAPRVRPVETVAQRPDRVRADRGQRQQADRGQREQRVASWGDRRSDVTAPRQAYRQRIQETREASRRSAAGLSDRYQRQAERNQQRYEERLRDQRRDYRQDRRGDRRDYRQAQRWDRQWRNNDRYDWQSYRYSNRDRYRLGRYYAPYRNHNYSRLSIGLFLGSGFYGNRYWISDPWQYRLPQAYPGTQWVRYYDDVLLVDVYNGEVIDVIYDFFW